MNSCEYIFAGGGTGGHLFPGLAVADALRLVEPQARITFFTTTRTLDRQLLEHRPYEQIEQPVRPATLVPWRWPGFWRAWRQSVRAAGKFLQARRPQAVLGLGGYAAGPAVVAARSLGIRTAILNPDAIPGRANRYLAGYADLVVLQWDVSRRHFPPGTNCQTLGCPIRAEFASVDQAAGRRHFDLDPQRPTLLVTGASQGARSVNETMYRVWPAFAAKHPDWQLLHLSGPANEADTRTAYGSLMAPQAAGTHIVGFTHEMHRALAAADVVVARAGASTLAELTVLGRPAILLPYPYHRDRHQHANAQVLIDAGAAVLVEDQRSADLNHKPLSAALEHLADAQTRNQMAQAAKKLGHEQSATKVATWLRNGTI